MTLADRETLAEQAAAMIDGLYVHLLQKRINTVTVPLDGSDPGAPASMRLEGFDGDNLVAADTLTPN